MFKLILRNAEKCLHGRKKLLIPHTLRQQSFSHLRWYAWMIPRSFSSLYQTVERDSIPIDTKRDRKHPPQRCDHPQFQFVPKLFRPTVSNLFRRDFVDRLQICSKQCCHVSTCVNVPDTLCHLPIGSSLERGRRKVLPPLFTPTIICSDKASWVIDPPAGSENHSRN